RLVLFFIRPRAAPAHPPRGAGAAGGGGGPGGPGGGPRATLSDLRLALVRALPAAGIECVLIDEAQHMFNAVSGPRLHQQMDQIKSMSNLSGVRHVLAGSPELLTLLELTPQLHRRSCVVRFPAYRRDRKKDRAQFLATFRALVNRIPLLDQRELSAEFEYVFENTAGCVGPLKDWLRRALARALRKGLPAIDGKVLRKTVLEPGAVQAIADDTDMRDGLSDRHDAGAKSARSPSGTDGRKRGQRRVQRKPGIDPVAPAQVAS
ncbi:MAG: AAA family ATPase, partial [Alphaproteobacteria bacterium]|nr:AAA family ATPase [Alphaproteobacteria bacterium]